MCPENSLIPTSSNTCTHTHTLTLSLSIKTTGGLYRTARRKRSYTKAPCTHCTFRAGPPESMCAAAWWAFVTWTYRQGNNESALKMLRTGCQMMVAKDWGIVNRPDYLTVTATCIQVGCIYSTTDSMKRTKAGV